MDNKLPDIKNLQNISSEQAAEYIRFVATLRHNQNRWFRNKSVDALNISRQMESGNQRFHKNFSKKNR